MISLVDVILLNITISLGYPVDWVGCKTDLVFWFGCMMGLFKCWGRSVTHASVTIVGI